MEPLYFYSGVLMLLAVVLAVLTFRVFSHKDKYSVRTTRALNAVYVTIFFLIITMTLLIMVEHYQGGNFELVNTDGYSIIIRERIKTIDRKDVGNLPATEYHIDEYAGFYVALPKDTTWNPPEKVKGLKAYLKKANLEGNKTNITSFLKWNGYGKLLECVFEDISMHPYNEMLFCLEQSLLFSEIGPALYSSQSILFSHPKTANLDIMVTGPNPFSVNALRGQDLMRLLDEGRKDKIKDQRVDLDFRNYFNVTILDKTNLDQKMSDLSAYLLKHSLNYASEADQLIASDGNILFTSSFTFRNAVYQEETVNFRIHRWVRFVEEADRLYILEMVFSPNSDKGGAIWKDMRLIFESFGRIGN